MDVWIISLVDVKNVMLVTILDITLADYLIVLFLIKATADNATQIISWDLMENALTKINSVGNMIIMDFVLNVPQNISWAKRLINVNSESQDVITMMMTDAMHVISHSSLMELGARSMDVFNWTGKDVNNASILFKWMISDYVKSLTVI